jgi:hypothetical protein
VKKLLMTEGLIACFFLALLLGIFGKYLEKERETQKTNTSSSVEEKRKKGTIKIYPGRLSKSFSPLQYQSQGEKNVLMLCFDNLLLRDENGVRCNKEITEAWEEKEEAIAHISTSYDEKKECSVITIQINPKAKTISGKAVNADDLLFNLYLRCDISVGGGDGADGVFLRGQEEYMYGSRQVKKRKKEISQSLKKPSNKLKKQLQKKIVEPELKKELEWVKGLYQDDAYDFICKKYAKPKDLFAHYYAYQTKYSSKGKTEKQVFEEIAAQYEWHYDWLAKVTNEDYEKEAEEIACAVFLQQEGKDTVQTIEGIQKKDDRTIVLEAIGTEDCVDALCDFWLLPLKEYGNASLFDGKKKFGFQKGFAEKILRKSYQKYQATGKYYAEKIKENRIVLVRNPHYFGKAAELEKITIVRKEYAQEQDIVEDLLCQRVDIAVTEKTKALEQLIQSRATHASYLIRKRDIKTSQKENCLLYRTSYVNVTSMPAALTEYQMIFQTINQLRVNTS